MVKDFKDYAELHLFAQSQHKLINDLSKKVVKLEEENKHLKYLLETTTDVVSKPKIVDLSEPDEETISRIQLAKIKENAFNRELTFEEAKKVEVYSKILNTALQNKKKTIEVSAQSIDSADLMKMLEDGAK